MKPNTQLPGLSTEVFAAQIPLRAQTLRAALCRNGHYFGIRPIKLPNGRLLWPANSMDRLTAQGGVK